jgi:acetyl esterase/lipase
MMTNPDQTLVPTPLVVHRPSGRDLAVDVFAAQGDSTRAAVILLHGGGWARGDRTMTHPYAQELARAGFVAIAAEYRLLGEAPWPAQIQDVKDVIRWTRANAASLGVDADKIAAEGFSAGGHLALLAAGTPNTALFGDEAGDDSLAAVVSFFAPVDLSSAAFPHRPPPLAALFGETGNDDLAGAASPIRYVGAAFPPTFLLNGLTDPFMPVSQTLQMFDALAAASVKADLHVYHDHTHEFARLPSMLGPVQDEIALFLRRAVVDPAHYAEENLTLNPFARGMPG